MVHFFIADDKSLNNIVDSLAFDENIHRYLYNNPVEFPDEISIISNLLEEGISETLTLDMIETLQGCCEEIMQCNLGSKFYAFFMKLNSMCEKAVRLNKNIYAIGD